MKDAIKKENNLKYNGEIIICLLVASIIIIVSLNQWRILVGLISFIP